MNIIVIVTLIILLSSVSAGYKHNDLQLALTWIGGFCQNQNNECDQKLVDPWDHQSFTIRGIFPIPTGAQRIGDFKLSNLDASVLTDMKNYWPPRLRSSDSPNFLWEYELGKRGKDYGAILYNLKPETFSKIKIVRNQQLQKAYFKDVIDTYKTLNAKKVPSGEYTKAKLAKTLGIKQYEFYTTCSKDTGDLIEVRICYRVQKTGWIREPCHSFENTCTKSYNLTDWKLSIKKTVYDIPATTLRHSLTAND